MGGRPRARPVAGVARLVTINLWGLAPPLDTRLALAADQLAALAPDIVAIQEVRPLDGVSGQTTADWLADALGGYACTYATSLAWAEGAFGDGFPAGEEGLAVLSRWPIEDRRVLRLPEPRPTEARILLSARLRAPTWPVWCHTTHLHWRLADGLARERQVLAIDGAIRALASDTDAPQLLCGDFNATPDSDEIRFLRGLTTLSGTRTHYQDAFAHAHPRAPGYTWSMTNPFTQKLRSLDTNRRIDYMFITSRERGGRGSVRGARVVLDAVRGGACASDHFGVLADVQLVPDPAPRR